MYPSEGGPRHVVQLPKRCREACFSTLFHGVSRNKGIIDDHGGLVGTILKSILACNLDVRAKVVVSLVVFGGGSIIPGL